MELWQLSATELAAGIRTREISAVEAVQSCPGRIEDVNPALNALVNVRPEEALADARWLADAGYEVEELELPLLAEAARLWSLLLFEDMRPMLPGMRELGDAGLRTHLEHASRFAAELWGDSPGITAYIQGWARRATTNSVYGWRAGGRAAPASRGPGGVTMPARPAVARPAGTGAG